MVGGPVAHHEGRAAPVGFLQGGHRRTHRAEAFGGQRVGRRTEHRRQRRLVPGTDLDQLGNRTEKPCATVILRKPRRAVLALQSHRERIDAGSQRSHFAFGAPFGGLQFGHPLVGQPQRGHRPLMVFIEPDLALIELADAALHGFELRPGLLRAGGGPFDALRKAGDAVVDRFDARPHGLDLTGQPGQALAPVRLRPDGREVGPIGLGGRALTVGQFRAGGVQPGAGRGQLRQQLLLGGRHLAGLGFQRVRIGVAGCRRLNVEMLGAFAGDAHRGAHPFGQCGQPEPGLLHRFGPDRELGQRGLVRGQLLGRHRQAGGGLVVLAAHGDLGLDDRVPLHLPVDQVVGGQAQPGVAQVGLDGLRATGHLGLAAQRFELAPQFGGQIREAGQVRRHRVELAEGFFLTLAMLEHARGFLDERAAILGARLQDLVELALPDDHMHLTADAGVAQQLLDIHQAAAAAVDFVFAGTVAEHPPRDRHLGVLDRQRVVGVVDGDGDFGAAQRGSRRGAGEDDVFHLSAAQGLGALLPHHPRQGVNHVGFAGTVGPDDGGNARLETQSRRRGEGLEALQRQTLEVHGEPDYRSDRPRHPHRGVSQASKYACPVTGPTHWPQWPHQSLRSVSARRSQ